MWQLRYPRLGQPVELSLLSIELNIELVSERKLQQSEETSAAVILLSFV